MVLSKGRRVGDFGELDDRGRTKRVGFNVKKRVVHNIDEECTARVINDSGNSKMVGKALGPAKEEIGNDGDRRGRMGVEPVDDGVVELAEGEHDGEVAVVADVADVFDAGGEFGVRRDG